MAVEISQFHHTPYYCEENVYMLCKKLCALGRAEPDAFDLFVVFISNDKKQDAFKIFGNLQNISQQSDHSQNKQDMYLKIALKFCLDKLSNPMTLSQTQNNMTVAQQIHTLIPKQGEEIMLQKYDSRPDFGQSGSNIDSCVHKQIPMWHQKASSRPDGLVLWDYHVICIQKTRGNSLALVWDLDSKLPIPTPLASYVSESIKSSFHLFPEFQRCFRIVHAPIFLKNFASDRRHMIDQDGAWLHQPPDYEPIVAADGTEHNLNEYMNIHSIEVVNSSELESISGIFSKKLGVVTTENQLEDFLHLLFAAMKSLNGIGTDTTMSKDLKE